MISMKKVQGAPASASAPPHHLFLYYNFGDEGRNITTSYHCRETRKHFPLTIYTGFTNVSVGGVCDVVV